MGRRIVLLVAAFLVAAVGTTLIFLYVSGVNDRALAGQRPVEVLVAKTTIPLGTTASDASANGWFETRRISSDSKVPTALREIKPIADQVALGTIVAGEQILPAKFGQPGSASELPIPGKKAAFSVQLGDPARVAGFVVPGSEVAVFVTIEESSNAPAPSAAGGTSGSTKPAETVTTQKTQLLLARAQVIAAGQGTLVSTTKTDQGSGTTQTEQLPKAILTLALDQKEGQKLIFASQQGQLYFALLNKDSAVTRGDEATTAENLFD